MMNETAITIRQLSKKYLIADKNYRKKRHSITDTVLLPYKMLRSAAAPFFSSNGNSFWALKDINLDIRHGEKVGIIGRNGAGKSTLLKILSRLVYPTEGEVRVRGRVTSLLEVGTGFNQNLTGRENIYLNASLYGLTPSEINEKLNDIVEFSGIGKFIDTKVKYYSSGMHMRLAFSVAAQLDPDILLLDEVLAVGDINFQQKCLKAVDGIASGGRTILFVSHSMSDIVKFCNRTIWLDEGKVVMDGPSKEVCDAYLMQLVDIGSSKQWEVKKPSEGTYQNNGKADNNKTNQNIISDQSDQLIPGNEYVRLVSVRVINADHETIVSISADQQVGLEITYDVLKEEKLLSPSFTLDTEKDVRMFTVVYTEPEYMNRIKTPGRYRSTVWIPGNFLNIGLIYVTAAITTPAAKLERHIVKEKIVSFYVLEVSFGGDGASGLYRELPGAVRPKLEWETKIEQL